MDKFLNSKFMQKLQEIGIGLKNNTFISAMQPAMGATMALVMVGAICQIISSVLATIGLIEQGGTVYNYILYPYHFTNDLLGVWITLYLAYNYSKNLQMKNPLAIGIESAVIFIMVCGFYNDGNLNMSFLSSTGMFTGFIVAFGVTKIEKFCFDHNVRIPMPEVCPPALVYSFAALIPFAICVLVFHGFNTVLMAISAGQMNIPILIMAVLSAPLSALTSTLGMFIICFLTLLLWCMGIHGGSITYPVIMASMIQAVQSNAALVEAGQAPVFAPVLLYGAMAAVGGTGNTMPLSLLCFKAKSKQLKSMAKITIIPSMFNINEPVIFGMPIMFNPVLAIPYILNSLVVMVFYLLAYQFHLITPSWILIIAILPMGLGSYLGTLDIRNAIMDYVMVIPSMLIWYPFFKKYDDQLLKEEQEKESALALQEAAV